MSCVVECPKPKMIEDADVILKITGSTVCGSDLHLLHGAVTELAKEDILGHEFCGVVDEMGSAVTGLQKGDRVVASFQIACGDCLYCRKKPSPRNARGQTPSHLRTPCTEAARRACSGTRTSRVVSPEARPNTHECPSEA